MDLIESVVSSTKRTTNIENRLALLNKHLIVSEGNITIAMGESSILLSENGQIRFTGYSQRINSAVSITLDDLIALIPVLVDAINDV